MPEHLVMFVARRGAKGERVAASLLLHDRQAIYGRYWGALEYIPCLHFEASYYAPMEWAIARGLVRFEGGAQGEHKMARGFLPVQTNSFHWLAHPAFNDAIARYLEREAGGIDEYLDELRERNPLRAGGAAPGG
jgi:predicted N-acyltransferase